MTFVRLAIVMAISATILGCIDSEDAATSRQCSLLDRDDIEEATSLSASDGELFEHEESGDGTWCLYVIDGKRIELQFQPGDRDTFDSERARAEREGVGLTDFIDIGDAAFFGTNGIPSTTAFVDEHLVVVQALDVVGPEASVLTSNVARVAAADCCPPDG